MEGVSLLPSVVLTKEVIMRKVKLEQLGEYFLQLSHNVLSADKAAQTHNKIWSPGGVTSRS